MHPAGIKCAKLNAVALYGPPSAENKPTGDHGFILVTLAVLKQTWDCETRFGANNRDTDLELVSNRRLSCFFDCFNTI